MKNYQSTRWLMKRHDFSIKMTISVLCNTFITQAQTKHKQRGVVFPGVKVKRLTGKNCVYFTSNCVKYKIILLIFQIQRSPGRVGTSLGPLRRVSAASVRVISCSLEHITCRNVNARFQFFFPSSTGIAVSPKLQCFQRWLIEKT